MLREASSRRGMPFEWSSRRRPAGERDQGVTIDTAHIRFRGPAREYAVIDAPGHHEFVRNMVTGAASAEAAVLVIDAGEGMQEQSRRHAYLLHLLGIRQIAVAINKMDTVGYSAARFEELRAEVRRYFASIGIAIDHVVPVVARSGNNLVLRGAGMDWYQGPTLITALEDFGFRRARRSAFAHSRPGCLQVRERRLIVGRVESGRIHVGDRVVFSPSNKTAHIASLEQWAGTTPKLSAGSDESVGLTLDTPLFIERGEIISHVQHPPFATDTFHARVFWLGRDPLERGAWFKLKLHACETEARITAIKKVLNIDDLGELRTERIERNGIGEVVLSLKHVAALDDFTVNSRTAFCPDPRLQYRRRRPDRHHRVPDRTPALLQAARNISSVSLRSAA